MLVGVEDPREKLLLKLGGLISQRFEWKSKEERVGVTKGERGARRELLRSVFEMNLSE